MSATDSDRLLHAIDREVRHILSIDLPHLAPGLTAEEYEVLAGHLTGALFITVNDLLPLRKTGERP